MIEVNDTNFDELVVNSKGIALLEVGAAWCPPCSKLKPILETLSAELTNVKFYEADADEAPGISKRFSIRSVPTMLVFKDGSLVKTLVGLLPKAKIEEALL